MTNRQIRNLPLTHFLIVGCSLVLGSWHATSHAQSSSRELGSDHKPMPSRLKAMLDDSSSSNPNKPAASLKLKEERVQQINDRIQLLKSIIDQERQAAMTKPLERKQPMKSTEKPNPLSSSSGTAPTMNKQMDKSMNQSMDDKMNQSMEKQLDQSMNEKMLPTFVPSIDTTKLATTLPNLSDKPVDALELAYSLYMTGNYSTAIKNLQSTLKAKRTPEETAWINCMMGCCYRMQQNFDESERLFRKTANQKSTAGISAKYASWQLRYIEGRRGAIEAMRNLDAELKLYTQEAPQ